ncbi:MAG: MotA/TolQ/ExbB proton channel family protein [Planctomycetes bacterium]|nr:MotA/TolQ/ExbB proton channel family protein [Planctomycetota bacterium]
MLKSRTWQWLMLAALLAALFEADRLSRRDNDLRAQDGAAASPTPDRTSTPPVAPSTNSEQNEGIEIFRLANEGGIFMYPIYALSLLAVGVIFERTIALRKDRVLPGSLISALGQLGDSREGFDPKQAYKICQAYPSAAASVIRAMLLKVGRPHAEVESTVQSVSEREATRLYGNVRWLTLCSTLAPLIGLLGTVQGMIVAFHRTTMIPVGSNKAVELANGIYTALVTTFGGLCVAIPAAFAAHYFEGRIQTMFLDIDNLLSSLLPQIERYEGRARFRHHDEGVNESETAAGPPAAAPPAAAPPSAAPPAVDPGAPPPAASARVAAPPVASETLNSGRSTV